MSKKIIKIECYILTTQGTTICLMPLKMIGYAIESVVGKCECGTILQCVADISYLFLCKKHAINFSKTHSEYEDKYFDVERCNPLPPYKFDKTRDKSLIKKIYDPSLLIV